MWEMAFMREEDTHVRHRSGSWLHPHPQRWPLRSCIWQGPNAGVEGKQAAALTSTTSALSEAGVSLLAQSLLVPPAARNSSLVQGGNMGRVVPAPVGWRVGGMEKGQGAGGARPECTEHPSTMELWRQSQRVACCAAQRRPELREGSQAGAAAGAGGWGWALHAPPPTAPRAHLSGGRTRGRRAAAGTQRP